MENTKYYSRNKLHQMMDQNESEVNELMKIFIQMVPIMLDDLSVFTKDGNWIECGNIAHKLKSSVRLWEIEIIDSDLVFVEENGRSSKNTELIIEKIKHINDILRPVLQQMELEIAQS